MSFPIPLRILLGATLAALTATVSADRGDRDRRHDRNPPPSRDLRPAPPPHVAPDRSRHLRPLPPSFRSRHWVLDNRHHHNRYYPARGYSVSILPPGYLNVGWRDRNYFFNAGVWFEPRGSSYVVVAPPAGLVVPTLPAGHTTLWVESRPYYYLNGVYYTPASGGYVTVDAPLSIADRDIANPTPSAALVPADDVLFLYPLRGQSAQRMSADRTECSSQAGSETGYDPARAPIGDLRRGDYLRAMSVCLEERGYSLE